MNKLPAGKEIQKEKVLSETEDSVGIPNLRRITEKNLTPKAGSGNSVETRIGKDVPKRKESSAENRNILPVMENADNVLLTKKKKQNQYFLRSR